MKLLGCNLCGGELEIINNDDSINKKVKCIKCNFTNVAKPVEPEVVFIRKRS
jgi:hypothetical protein